MIIRKPYAFLIKNFKKIHILLLVLAIYIYVKTNQLYAFLREFIQTATYDYMSESITKYVTPLGTISLLVLIVSCAIIIRLLKRKEKPWKLYLVPVAQYIIIFLAFTISKNYFNTYTGAQTTTSLRMWRDLLFVSQLTQFGTFIIFFIRIFGFDLNKFNFKLDEEYLELEARDREELEININVDKEAFKRNYRKFKRNLNYIYQEHKFICNIIITAVILIVGFNSAKYVMNHRAYKEGSAFNVGGYEVTINNSYYSDKSYNGTQISKTSSFVIIDLTIKNIYSSKRDLSLNRYHVMNGVRNYTTTEKLYGTEFQDLGKTYNNVSLRGNESINMIMVYKVDKKLNKNNFVLYYQEFEGDKQFLRKIKLKMKDYSKIEKCGTKELGDTMSFNMKTQEEEIAFDDYEILTQTEYVYNVCSSTECSNSKAIYKAPNGYYVMKLTFSSDTFEGKDLKEFAVNYGKIIYYDKDGNKKEIKLEVPIPRTYYGKYLYVKIPSEVGEAQSFSFDFTIRNKNYIYKIF